MFVLKRTDICPPGSFFYEQTQGLAKKFEATPDLDGLAALVSEFRTANNLERATKAEAFTDIENYNCARLGNNPAWCRDTDSQTYRPPIATRTSGGCGGCGAVVK